MLYHVSGYLLKRKTATIYDNKWHGAVQQITTSAVYEKTKRFKHDFGDCVNPFRTCSLKPESTSHLLLHYHYYNYIRITLFDELCSVGTLHKK